MPDVASNEDIYTVFILPALPSNWPRGSIKNARLRGGYSVSFSWAPAPQGLTSLELSAESFAVTRQIRFVHNGQTIKEMTTSPGMSVKLV